LAGARQFSEKQGIAAGMSQNVSDLAGVGPGFEELRRVLRTQRRGLQPLDGAAFHEHPTTRLHHELSTISSVRADPKKSRRFGAMTVRKT